MNRKTQNLIIDGFLGIRDAYMEIGSLTILIGPQASGKSVIARLLFFCIEYFSDFDDLALMKNEHKSTYDRRKKEGFYKLFPPYSWKDDEVKIIYADDRHYLELTSKAGAATIEIHTSPSVATSFRLLKKAYADFRDGLPDESRGSPTRMMREFKSQHPSIVEDLQKPPALFVPAARSFYANIRQEIFSILSIDEKIDKIIMQFGEFYEGAKYLLQFDHERSGRRISRRALDQRRFFDPVIRGRYALEDGREWIVMERGRIEMNKASSGQQEALPLLCALSQFPGPGKTLLIEEPEAHLFPTAQVKIMEFIVQQVVSMETNIFITTHSPYMLSVLNNFLLMGSKGMEGGIDPRDVRAYAISNGYCSSILDADSGLISADYIDSVSEEIEDTFLRILEGAND